MTVADLWTLKDGKTPSRRWGRGLRYQVRVPGQPAKSFRLKGAADTYDLKLRSGAELPKRPEAQNVDELVDSWLSGKEHLSKGGYNAVAAGAMHVRARWTGVPADEVEPDKVQSWIAGLKVERRHRGGPPTIEKASQASRSKALSAMRGAMGIAVQKGQIDKNPCSETKAGGEVLRDPQFLTAKQLRKLAGKAGEYAPMVWLLGTTGVRVGECCNLNVGDVTKKRGQGYRLRVRKSKNGKGRDVPIPATVAAMLNLKKRDKMEPLFTTVKRGCRIDRNKWRAMVFRQAAESAKLPGLHIHDLRHTAASLMILSGATVKDVQHALGHVSASMTLNLYAGWWDTGLDDVAVRMNKLVSA